MRFIDQRWGLFMLTLLSVEVGCYISCVNTAFAAMYVKCP